MTGEGGGEENSRTTAPQPCLHRPMLHRSVSCYKSTRTHMVTTMYTRCHYTNGSARPRCAAAWASEIRTTRANEK